MSSYPSQQVLRVNRICLSEALIFKVKRINSKVLCEKEFKARSRFHSNHKIMKFETQEIGLICRGCIKIFVFWSRIAKERVRRVVEMIFIYYIALFHSPKIPFIALFLCLRDLHISKLCIVQNDRNFIAANQTKQNYTRNKQTINQNRKKKIQSYKTRIEPQSLEVRKIGKSNSGRCSKSFVHLG